MLTNIIYHFFRLHSEHFNLYNFSDCDDSTMNWNDEVVAEEEDGFVCRWNLLWNYFILIHRPSSPPHHIIISSETISLKPVTSEQQQRRDGSYLQLDFVFMHIIPQIYYFSSVECLVGESEDEMRYAWKRILFSIHFTLYSGPAFVILTLMWCRLVLSFVADVRANASGCSELKLKHDDISLSRRVVE